MAAEKWTTGEPNVGPTDPGGGAFIVRTTQRTPRRPYTRYPHRAIRLHLEALEHRTLPTNHVLSGALSSVLASESKDTIDQAQGLGDLSTLQQVEVAGTVGRGTSGAAEVDWYRFTLDRPSAITVATRTDQPHSPLVSVLSLYGSSARNSNSLAVQVGYRLIAQDDGADHEGHARLDRALAAGTYFVAVSGSGNRYFHPLIAGSGYPGSAGDYELVIQAVDLNLHAADGPAVLATDPTPGADRARSPFVIRIDFSTALDPASVRLGSNVRLRSVAGTITDTQPQPVPLAFAYFDKAANELDVTPTAPLRPGSYELALAGQRGTNPRPLTDSAGNPLGKSAIHPSGDDFTLSFRIGGMNRNQALHAGAGDTPATAQDLGELVDAGLVQVAGAIGDDPTDFIPFDPANVDLYHFHLRGMGQFAFTSEVFAGRIGSALDPALSLFRIDLSDHQLHFVASNDNSFNPILTHDGASEPLFTDPILNVGLTEGDYYLAVSSSNNVPMPAFGRLPGTGGIFDPNVSHSGKNGSTIGEYVLNLAAEPMKDSPRVSGIPVMDGSPLTQDAVLTAPPTSLSVNFDKTVNLREMVRQTGLPIVNAIYIQGSQGSKFFPHLVQFAENGKHTEFLMHDALPNGIYQLHLSSAQGLTDLAGNLLVGNDPSGDYVVRFTVNGPTRGSNGKPRDWLDKEPNDDPSHPQDLGVLFPMELQAGVVLERGSSATGASDTADYYQFKILQNALFSFGLNSSIAHSGIGLSLIEASGKAIPLVQSRSDGFVHATVNLKPRTYILGISGWSAAVAPKLTYRLNILSFGQEQEQSPPLSIGPGPAIRIRPVTLGASAALDASVPAASSAGVGTAQGGAHDLGASPSGAFHLLTAGPVGGLGNIAFSSRPSDPYETILAHTPDVLFAQIVARLPLLIPSQHSGTVESTVEPGQLLQWLQTVLHQFEKLNWSQALDLLHSSRAWQEKIRIRLVNVRPEDMPENSLPEDEDEPISAAGEDQQSGEILWETVSPAWVMAAAFAMGIPREPGRRQGRHRTQR